MLARNQSGRISHGWQTEGEGRKGEGPKLDARDWVLLDALQRDGRIGFARLGRLVGLSPPATAERVRRFQAQGLIHDYRAELDPARIAPALRAFVRLRCAPEVYEAVAAFARDTPEILECHHVAGEDTFILRLVSGSVGQLDQVLIRLAEFGSTTSSIVLSSPVASKPITAAALG